MALGMLVDEPCTGCNSPSDGSPKPPTSPVHCGGCSGRVEVDSLWGIVIENSTKAIEDLVKGGVF